jgi:rhodanese-related sulfurtransferase
MSNEVLIDLREDTELVKTGGLKAASRLPLSSILKGEYMDVLSKDDLNVFFCASGVRAQAAVEFFSKMDYKCKNGGKFYMTKLAKGILTPSDIGLVERLVESMHNAIHK